MGPLQLSNQLQGPLARVSDNLHDGPLHEALLLPVSAGELSWTPCRALCYPTLGLGHAGRHQGP